MARSRAAAVVILALAFVATACGGSKESGGGTVSVQLKEWVVSPTPVSIKAGTVTFAATNAGTTAHELVIVKTDLALDALPMKDNAVDEEAPGLQKIGEIEEVEPGKTESETFTLAAGSYVLMCNLPTHYQQGMRAWLTVT